VAFQRTWRLREILLFLCDRVLTDPAHPPREAEIGVAVFGRGDDFDPGVDPLVRVQTSQLRKRLKAYFAGEGASEPLVIEIPKGAYAPAFRERAALEPPADEPEEDEDVPPRTSSRAALVAAGVLLVACAVLAVQNLQLRRGTVGRAAPPHVARLWSQLVGRGRTTYVVIADAGLSVFLETTHRILSPTSYQRGEFDTRYRRGPPPGPTEPDPPEVVFARSLLPQSLTGSVDAALAHHVGALGASVGGTTRVLFAREATPDLLRAGTLVLSGSRRANPWTDLFEDRLIFQGATHKGVAVFRDADPRPGEEAEFRAVPDQIGYCRIALTSNLDQTGPALLITGTDFLSTGAGVELLADDAAMADLARALGLDARAPFPRFEAMLRVRYVAGAPLKYERVAQRISTGTSVPRSSTP
jgi:hypothetical protein